MSEFKTISEVAEQLQLPQHVLRFWESQFSQIKPAKRRGGRRFYNSQDLETIQRIKTLLYVKGYTIKGAKKALNQHFVPTGVQKPVIAEKKPTETYISSVTPMPDKTELKRILNQLKDAQNLLNQQA